MSFSWLEELSIRQLKAAAHDVGVDTDGICEKAELLAAVRASPKKGKLVKKNVLAAGYCGRIQKKTEKKEGAKVRRAKYTDVVYHYAIRFHDNAPRCRPGGTILLVDMKKTVGWLKHVIYKTSVEKGDVPMPTRDKLQLRFFPVAGTRTSFNVIAAKVQYANPAEHGLSGQPRLLDDDFATLEAIGFSTDGESYVRVESATESPELRV